MDKNSENKEQYFFFYGHKQTETISKSCLSQWYLCRFEVDGHIYNCMEQYMMASKALVFKDYEMLEKILNETDQKTIKKLGRQVRGFDTEKWNEVKYDIVLKGNLAKFSQNPELREFLLSTGDAILVEASPFDRIWGIGMRESEAAKDSANWRGKNLLGKALTEVKNILRNNYEK